MAGFEQFEKWLERQGAAYRALETEVAALRASNAELLAENKRLKDSVAWLNREFNRHRRPEPREAVAKAKGGAS